MKVLWFSPVILPDIAKQCGLSVPASGGWIEGMASQIVGFNEIELTICFCTLSANKFTGATDQYQYFGYPVHSSIVAFQDYIEKIKPDIVHIFGTENENSNSIIKACETLGLQDYTVINVQGIVSVISKHFTAFLPNSVIYGASLRDILKHNNVFLENKKYERRGLYEIDTIKRAHHIIGRTEWDKVCIFRINSEINYYHNNESLRSVFYENEWNEHKCERYSIFVSQCSYPLKGFHLMLEAMADVKKKFPSAKLYVTGNDPISAPFRERLKQTKYMKYIVHLIKRYNLTDTVVFCGKLSAEQMCDRYLKSNVFVCCSTIENSSNSVGEAMLLGVPVVASDVGGIKSLLEDNKEGLLYQADAPYMLANCICKIFEDSHFTRELSANARIRASITHDRDNNRNCLLNIYKSIYSGKGKYL